MHNTHSQKISCMVIGAHTQSSTVPNMILYNCCSLLIVCRAYKWLKQVGPGYMQIEIL